MNNRAVDILQVEDSQEDVRLTIEALKESGIAYHLNVVEDGVEAIAYLRREGSYRDAVRPDIILLDLNLPRKDGREVLAEIKNDAKLKRIPVIILTTSNTEMDILKSYNLEANCFLTKPIDWKDYIALVKSIEGFWTRILNRKTQNSNQSL